MKKVITVFTVGILSIFSVIFCTGCEVSNVNLANSLENNLTKLVYTVGYLDSINTEELSSVVNNSNYFTNSSLYNGNINNNDIAYSNLSNNSYANSTATNYNNSFNSNVANTNGLVNGTINDNALNESCGVATNTGDATATVLGGLNNSNVTGSLGGGINSTDTTNLTGIDGTNTTAIADNFGTLGNDYNNNTAINNQTGILNNTSTSNNIVNSEINNTIRQVNMSLIESSSADLNNLLVPIGQKRSVIMLYCTDLRAGTIVLTSPDKNAINEYIIMIKEINNYLDNTSGVLTGYLENLKTISLTENAQEYINAKLIRATDLLKTRYAKLETIIESLDSIIAIFNSYGYTNYNELYYQSSLLNNTINSNDINNAINETSYSNDINNVTTPLKTPTVNVTDASYNNDTYGNYSNAYPMNNFQPNNTNMPNLNNYYNPNLICPYCRNVLNNSCNCGCGCNCNENGCSCNYNGNYNDYSGNYTNYLSGGNLQNNYSNPINNIYSIIDNANNGMLPNDYCGSNNSFNNLSNNIGNNLNINNGYGLNNLSNSYTNPNMNSTALLPENNYNNNYNAISGIPSESPSVNNLNTGSLISSVSVKDEDNSSSFISVSATGLPTNSDAVTTNKEANKNSIPKENDTSINLINTDSSIIKEIETTIDTSPQNQTESPIKINTPSFEPIENLQPKANSESIKDNQKNSSMIKELGTIIIDPIKIQNDQLKQLPYLT